MLQVTQKGGVITAETAGGRLSWDAAGGGQICQFVLKDELSEHPVQPRGQLLSDLHFDIDGRRVRLAGAPTEFEIILSEADLFKFTARSRLLDGGLLVRQEYEVHEEGAVFCNLVIEVASGKSLELGGCGLDMALDISASKRTLWGHFLRQMCYKRDYASIHPYLDARVRRQPQEISDERELFPFVSLDLGWGNTRFYTNHVEFILEEWTALGDGPWTNTRTRAGQEDSLWRLSWRLYEGSATKLDGPKRYSNRWGMLFSRARSRSGAGADPALRNNALGSRMCHVKYPYAREGHRWPWVSMPIKQVEQQAPQLFEGNPPVERADEAANAGANMLILHQFWMSNPGTNNEPPSDYKAFDPAWLKSFIDRCHQRQMRVMLYVRGTEPWLQYSPFFEDYLQKDRDGMYADWNSVFFMGYNKSSPLHMSMHSYFHFTKSMRQRVGSGGLMVGHTNRTNQLTLAAYDAALNGETSVRHDELLVNPELTAYYACLHGVGGHLISGNLPDRKAFSSPKAAALCAALSMSSHAALEPGLDFAKCSAYLKPLWSSMAALPGNVTRLHNPVFIPTRAVATAQENFYPSVWQGDKGHALLLVTNMAASSQSGSVELNLDELDVPKGATIRPLDIPGTFVGTASAGGVQLSDMPTERIAAFLIGK